MSNELVLVTGGTGFIGAHCIIQLLHAGYRVRTTMRSLSREKDVRAMLGVGGILSTDQLSFFQADLLKDDGWAAATEGCDFVLHVASPLPVETPRDENDLITPAREGTLRVLRASRDAGVKRVVLTSSFAAIGYGAKEMERTFTEADWTDVNAPGLGAYAKSKTLAERAAWDFIAREGGAIELSVVNPVMVFGPVLGPDYSASIAILRRMLDGKLPGLPRFSFGVVDVRDVADLHLKAMTNPAAKGERFLAVAGGFMSMQAIAAILQRRMGDTARRVTTRSLPDWVMRVVGRFNRSVGQMVPELGKRKNASNEKARQMLGWEPRSNEESIIATAESLVRLKLVNGVK